MIANRRIHRRAKARGQGWPRFTTTITPPRLRQALLAGASGAAIALTVGVASPAWSAGECGVAVSGGTITCTTADNPYPNGIEYKVNDLTVVVQDGVIINTTGAAEAGGVVSGGGNYGNLTVTVGTAAGAGVIITTDGNDAEGISVQTDGTATITSFADVTTLGVYATGIKAYGAGAKIVSSGDITTTSKGSDALNAVTIGISEAYIKSDGNLTTSGSNSRGIYADGGGYGATVITAGDIATSGDSSTAIRARTSNLGSVSITSTGDISTEGGAARGISAYAERYNITITTTGDISTIGNSATAIQARVDHGPGTITVTSKGDISTEGGGADGIYAQQYNGNGDVVVSSTGNISTKSGFARAIMAYGRNVIITSTGDLSTQGDEGIGIGAVGADSVTVISAGDIATEGASGAFGIGAVSASGDVTIAQTGDISTKGAGSSAIFGTGDSITITSTGDLATEGVNSLGIVASAVNDIEVTSTGNIATVGDGASAIRANATGGAIEITSTGNMTTAGDGAVGLYAIGDQATVTSTGNITTTGASASGIKAQADTDSVVVTGTGNISATGTGSHGIYGRAYGSGATLKIASTGDIDAFQQGIQGDADGAVVISSNGNVTSTYGMGIQASSNTGSVRITSHGDVLSYGTGIQAQSGAGLVEITGSGTVTTTYSGAAGIQAIAGNAHIYAQNMVISTKGLASDGIIVVSSGASQFIVFAGDVSATGRDARGVVLHNYGESFLSVRGDVLGGWDDGAAGIDIKGNDDSQVQIADGATVGALNDVAILNYNEDLEITNLGTITGSFGLGGGADSLRNLSADSVELRYFADTDGDGVRDTENLAIADFGAGADVFDNDGGTLRLGSVSGATKFDTTGTITHPGGGNSDITQEGVEQGHIGGLEIFYNSGLITLSDGTAGDLLVITEAATGAIGGSGQFISRGGALALDFVADGSGQSDILVVDNAVTDTGPTKVLVNLVGGGGPTTGDGIQVIHVTGTSDDDAFTDGGGAVAGAYQYELHFQNEAKSDQNWYLRSSFFEGALDYPSISTGALMTWYSDLGGLHERLSERRAEVEDGQLAALNTASDLADAGALRRNDGGDGGWFRVSGSNLDIEQTGASDFDLSTVRAQGGFDLGFNDVAGRGDWLVVGALAGYGWSSADFDTGSAIDFDVATMGAYATYFRGPYYLDALVKFDWLDGDYNSSAVSDDGDVELPVFGLSLETGYRFDLTQNGFYLQPQAQLAYAHAGDDSITDNSGSVIELEDADSLRGRLGARIGQELSTNAGAAAEPVRGNFYLEAAVAQEFLGETDARVSGLTLEQELPETTFELGGGFDIALPKDGITFTIDADYILGDEVEGVSATGGFRINW